MKKTTNKGFTLIEVMAAIFLMALAIVSLISASMISTNVNSKSTTLTTAEFLVEEVRELTALLGVVDPQSGTAAFGAEEGSLAGYDDIDDLDGVTFSPPINAARATLTDFSQFTQQITVQNVSAADFQQVVSDHGSDFVKITVDVYYNNEPVSSSSWIRARY